MNFKNWWDFIKAERTRRQVVAPVPMKITVQQNGLGTGRVVVVRTRKNGGIQNAS